MGNCLGSAFVEVFVGVFVLMDYIAFIHSNSPSRLGRGSCGNLHGPCRGSL